MGFSLHTFILPKQIYELCIRNVNFMESKIIILHILNIINIFSRSNLDYTCCQLSSYYKMRSGKKRWLSLSQFLSIVLCSTNSLTAVSTVAYLAIHHTKVMKVGSDSFGDPLNQKVLKKEPYSQIWILCLALQPFQKVPKITWIFLIFFVIENRNFRTHFLLKGLQNNFNF